MSCCPKNNGYGKFSILKENNRKEDIEIFRGTVNELKNTNTNRTTHFFFLLEYSKLYLFVEWKIITFLK